MYLFGRNIFMLKESATAEGSSRSTISRRLTSILEPIVLDNIEKRKKDDDSPDSPDTGQADALASISSAAAATSTTDSSAQFSMAAAPQGPGGDPGKPGKGPGPADKKPPPPPGTPPTQIQATSVSTTSSSSSTPSTTSSTESSTSTSTSTTTTSTTSSTTSSTSTFQLATITALPDQISSSSIFSFTFVPTPTSQKAVDNPTSTSTTSTSSSTIDSTISAAPTSPPPPALVSTPRQKELDTTAIAIITTAAVVGTIFLATAGIYIYRRFFSRNKDTSQDFGTDIKNQPSSPYPIRYDNFNLPEIYHPTQSSILPARLVSSYASRISTRISSFVLGSSSERTSTSTTDNDPFHYSHYLSPTSATFNKQPVCDVSQLGEDRAGETNVIRGQATEIEIRAPAPSKARNTSTPSRVSASTFGRWRRAAAGKRSSSSGSSFHYGGLAKQYSDEGTSEDGTPPLKTAERGRSRGSAGSFLGAAAAERTRSEGSTSWRSVGSWVREQVPPVPMRWRDRESSEGPSPSPSPPAPLPTTGEPSSKV